MIKKLFVVMMMLMSITYTNAEIIKEGKTYSQVVKSKTPDKDSGFTYKDNKGNIYPILIGKSGACYIVRISKKSGKEYKQYLGKEISIEICKELNINYKSK